MPSSVKKILSLLFSLALFVSLGYAQNGKALNQNSKAIEKGSKFYVAPMEGKFDIYVAAAIVKKQVPIIVVTDRTKADYEITGISESEKAGWAKMLFLGSEQSREQASVKVVDLKSSEVIYGYNVHKSNSFRGRQSVL